MQQCYHIEALATTFLEIEALLVRFGRLRHGGGRSLTRDAGPRYKFFGATIASISVAGTILIT